MPALVASSTVPAIVEDREERRRLHHDADIVIVGAGIAGCALAVALGKQGRSVILLEQSLKEPDRIVGELLQPGGVAALAELGIADCLDDIDAVPVKGYDVIYYGEEVKIPYPNSAAHPKAERPEGRSFHHGRFIQNLRAAAARTPNVTVVEATATDLIENGWTGQILGVQCNSAGKRDYVSKGSEFDTVSVEWRPFPQETNVSQYFGQLTVIADGYNSKFRKKFIATPPVARSKFWGLELIDAELPLSQHGHVVLGDGAPVLLYQIGSRETRALVDIPEKTPSASIQNGGVKAHLRNVVLPSLPEMVRPSFEEAIERGKLRSMPNSYLPPSTNRTPGMIMLGDAMNMRHPLTGGGMTVAFNDVVLLADLLSPAHVPHLDDTKAVLRQMSAFHWHRKGLSSVINILAQALYSLFAANDTQLKALQLGCFRYFQRGGNCIDGPVGLLAGIIRQPLVLFYHFFAVALYAMWIRLSESSLTAMPFTLLSSLNVLWKACSVIFPYMISEFKR